MNTPRETLVNGSEKKRNKTHQFQLRLQSEIVALPSLLGSVSGAVIRFGQSHPPILPCRLVAAGWQLLA